MADPVGMAANSANRDNEPIVPGSIEAKVVQRKALDEAIKESERRQPALSGESTLVSYIQNAWNAAQRAKQEVTEELYESALQRRGEYTARKLAEIKKLGGSTIFMKITSIKCRALESWIRDILSPVGDAIWTIRPTPIPDIPIGQKEYINQYVQQQVSINPALKLENPVEYEAYLEKNVQKEIEKRAAEACAKMSKKIADQLAEANWREELEKVISDIATYKVGVLKGPLAVRKKDILWQQQEGTGRWVPIRDDTFVVQYKRVSPFDIYPSPTATNVENGYLIERHTMTREDLNELIGVRGFDEMKIRSVLEKYGESGYSTKIMDDQLKEEAENKNDDNITNTPDNTIEVLEFWGSCPGKLLVQFGIEGIESNTDDYHINAWLVGDDVIKAVINPSPIGRKPYHKTSFELVPDSWWGQGVPEVMSDLQAMCNASARALSNNMGIASGPQGYVDVSQLASGQDVRNMYPWKMWLYDGSAGGSYGGGRPPIGFFQPNDNADTLMAVYEKFARLADDYTGIPAYTYGSVTNIGGAGRALADYEKVLTPYGPIPIRNIKIGDKVCNTYGTTSNVVGVFPQGKRDIVRIKFSNGTHIDCDMEHRWSVRTRNNRKFHTLTTREIIEKGILWKTREKVYNNGICYTREDGYLRPKWMLPLIDSIEFKAREIKIDPYTMGILLGDGDANCNLVGMDDEIFDRIPYQLGKRINRPNNKSYKKHIKGIRKYYHNYGLNCKGIDKFIPEDYLYNTKEVRLELLRGLMDTDGYCTQRGQTVFCSSSKRLIYDFRKLVESLGGYVRSINKQKGVGNTEICGVKCFGRDHYRVYFKLFGEKVFHLKRKQLLVKDAIKTHIAITGIEYLGMENATCISVDSDDSLFICENFIPTHNTATGLSMLLGNASKGIKFVLSNLDTYIIEPSIRDLYEFNMLYDPDESIKADLKIVARGTLSLVEKEHQQAQRVEFLQTIATSPMYQEIIGKKGAANLLREVVKVLNMPADDIVPSEEEIEASDVEQQMLQQTASLVQGLVAGQVSPEEFIAAIVQMFPPQQQNAVQPGMNKNMNSTNHGTPPAMSDRTPDGRRLGGVDSSYFVNK
jgi:hypothetical protein